LHFSRSENKFDLSAAVLFDHPFPFHSQEQSLISPSCSFPCKAKPWRPLTPEKRICSHRITENTAPCSTSDSDGCLALSSMHHNTLAFRWSSRREQGHSMGARGRREKRRRSGFLTRLRPDRHSRRPQHEHEAGGGQHNEKAPSQPAADHVQASPSMC
jgi:hypothetical protein